jgi:hypothetical protein
MTIHYLYWYKLPEHTCAKTQGYIGITNDIERRKLQHKYQSNPDNLSYVDTHFYRAVNAYGGIDALVFEILHEGTFEEICKLENDYRPQLHVGWNIAVGGAMPGAVSIFKGITDRWDEEQKANIGKHHKGKKLSEEHIQALKEKNKANESLGTKVTLYHQDDPDTLYTYHSLSEASRQLGIPLSRIKSKHLRKYSSYGDDGWAILFDPEFDRNSTPTAKELRSKAISKALKEKHTSSG